MSLSSKGLGLLILDQRISVRIRLETPKDFARPHLLIGRKTGFRPVNAGSTPTGDIFPIKEGIKPQNFEPNYKVQKLEV